MNWLDNSIRIYAITSQKMSLTIHLPTLVKTEGHHWSSGGYGCICLYLFSQKARFPYSATNLHVVFISHVGWFTSSGIDREQIYICIYIILYIYIYIYIPVAITFHLEARWPVFV